MRFILLVLVLSCPALGQWTSLEFRFQGIGCAECVESLPERVGRIRGVEKAKVDAVKGTLSVTLIRENRVRVEQIRDFIEQDGTKVVEVVAAGRGSVVAEDGKLVFRLAGQANGYAVESVKAVAPGDGVVSGGVVGRTITVLTWNRS